MDYRSASINCKNTYFPVSPFENKRAERLPDNVMQTHTHEFTASTELALKNDLRHNHRFAGVTSEAIPAGRSHIHRIKVNTTFDFNHFHELRVKTGPAETINSCDRRNGQVHVHCVEGETTVNGAVPHDHDFQFVTLAAPNPPSR